MKKFQNMILAPFFGFLLLSGLSGCAVMIRDWQASHCNSESAYQMGYNDARSGQLMNSYSLSSCGAESQNALVGAYRDGYEVAKGELARERFERERAEKYVPRPRPRPEESGISLNIKVGDSSVGMHQRVEARTTKNHGMVGYEKVYVEERPSKRHTSKKWNDTERQEQDRTERQEQDRTERQEQDRTEQSPADAQRECHLNYGKEVCGYNCIESYGKYYCANQPEDNCVQAYGKVKCGYKCEVKSFGNIECKG